jgi:hypothetical protein
MCPLCPSEDLAPAGQSSAVPGEGSGVINSFPYERTPPKHSPEPSSWPSQSHLTLTTTWALPQTSSAVSQSVTSSWTSAARWAGNRERRVSDRPQPKHLPNQGVGM